MINFIAVVGLQTFVSFLEKNMLVEHVNMDIDYLSSRFDQFNKDMLHCENSYAEVVEIQGLSIHKTSQNEDIQAASLKVGTISLDMATCFERLTIGCLEMKSKECLKETISSFAECLAIAGYHLDAAFSEQEKDIYRKILSMNHGGSSDLEIIQMSTIALPVLSTALFRMGQQLTALNKANLSTSDRL